MSETMEQSKYVVHADDVPARDIGKGSFGAKPKWLAWAAGNRKLGCTLYELPAGKKSFPYHWHIANEEGLYMLEGECTLRLAGKEIPLRAGHYVALPIGEEGAHQLINNSGATCRYLCFSTLQDPEVVIYPDSGKIAFSHRGKEQTDRTKWQMRKILAAQPELEYFHGEE